MDVIQNYAAQQTLEMLEKLAEHRWIGSDSATILQNAYRYLVALSIVYRCDMTNKPHTLPNSEVELTQISNLMGYDHLDEFKEGLQTQLEFVQQEYAKLFENEPRTCFRIR